MQVAILADLECQDELERVLTEPAQDWDGRVEMKLLGPQAAYDFVVTPKPERQG